MNSDIGLINKSGNKPVPLKGIAITGWINDFLSTTLITQTFCNEEESPIEAEYSFPITDNTAIQGLEIELDNGRVLTAKIEEKEEAKEKYEDQMASGHRAFMGQMDATRPDKFVLSIGNLPPGVGCKVMLTIAAPLVCDDSQWRYSIPSGLLPKDLQYTSSFNLSISAQSNIQDICAKDLSDFSTEVNGSTATISSQDVSLSGREIHITFRTENTAKPSALVSRTASGDMAGMISFIPQFLEEGEDEDDLEGIGEFIILIDRSGSMSCGQRMKLARDAAIFFVKSLPINCTFNVISYGSQFSPMFPRSVEYSEENVENAVAQIQTFNADMCGNEEYTPLKWIFDFKPEYPRSVFLISDGGVGQATRLYQIIRENVNNSRLHAFGIGQGAEKDIIMNLAKSGKGVHEFVEENETFQHKVVAVLKKAIMPALSKWSIEWDKGEPEQSPTVAYIPNLYAGESFTLFARFPDSANVPSLVTLNCFNTKTNSQEQYQVAIDATQAIEGDGLHKLWASSKIKELQHQNQSEEPKGDLKVDMKRISIDYQVPCSETAFIALAKNKEATTEDIELRKVPIVEQSISAAREEYHGRMALRGRGGAPASMMMAKASSGIKERGMMMRKAPAKGKMKEVQGLSMMKSAAAALPAKMALRVKDAPVSSSDDSGEDFAEEAPRMMMKAAPMRMAEAAMEPMEDLLLADSAAPSELMDFMSSAPPPPAAPAAAVYVPKSTPVPKQTLTNPDEILMLIIKTQSVTGAWKPEILRQLSPSTSKPGDLDDATWATIVALAFLEQKLSEKAGEWALVAKKAAKWLRMKKVDVKSYEISF